MQIMFCDGRHSVFSPPRNGSLRFLVPANPLIRLSQLNCAPVALGPRIVSATSAELPRTRLPVGQEDGPPLRFVELSDPWKLGYMSVPCRGRAGTVQTSVLFLLAVVHANAKTAIYRLITPKA